MKRIVSATVIAVFLISMLIIPVGSKDATTGNIANVIVCVRFSDDSADDFTSNTDKIIKLYNDTTGLESTSNYDFSFKKYISDISRNKLNVENTFPQLKNSVISTLTLSVSTTNCNDDSQIITDVIKAFNDGIITLPSGKYDYRTEGIIDNLTVLIQGKSSDNSILWPHKSISAVQTKINGIYNVGNYNFIDSNSLLGTYSITQQGTISHEFLHTVGFPDLYRNGVKPGSPVGFWDIMASDSMYQQYPLSYMRYTMGWVPMQSISESGDYTLDAVTDPISDKIIYKLETPFSTNEFFVIEYRFKDPAYTSVYGGSKHFDAKLPSSGMIIYRVNNGVEYKTNIAGEDYIYVFRPDETGLTDSKGDIINAAVDPFNDETSYGSADMSADFTDNTIFYSNGQNSGIVISNITPSDNGSQISFHVQFQDYSSMDLWSNVGSSVAEGSYSTKGTADDNGNIYTLSSAYVSNNPAVNVYKFVNGGWSNVASAISGASEAYIQTFNNELYIIYTNSSGHPVIAKLGNGAWKTIHTDNSAFYPISPQLFKSEDMLYCGWADYDNSNVVIKSISGSTVTVVNNTLTASYFANPAFTASGNYIYAIYSDFFGTDKNTQLKRYNITTKKWDSLTIPSPINGSNVHRAADNNGELWFLAAGYDSTPIVLTVKNTGEVTEMTVPTEVESFLDIGITVSDTGILLVGMFTSQDNSEVLYLEKGVWKKLGLNPCDAVHGADMFIFENDVYVVSATYSNGSLVVRSKSLPEIPVARLIARDATDIVVKDGYAIGIPAGAVSLSLYFEVSEEGSFIYTGMRTGDTIYLYSADNVLISTYTIVVLGDINSDNSVNGMDSVLIGCIIGGMNGFNDAQVLAADVDRNGILNEMDRNAVADKGLFI